MASKKEMPKEMAFEEAMEQLETIVEGMESENLPLENLVTSYEKGIKLLKICQSRIDDAQERIELIAKQAGDGDEFSLTDFDPEGSAGEERQETPIQKEKEEESDEVRLL